MTSLAHWRWITCHHCQTRSASGNARCRVSARNPWHSTSESRSWCARSGYNLRDSMTEQSNCGWNATPARSNSLRRNAWSNRALCATSKRPDSLCASSDAMSPKDGAASTAGRLDGKLGRQLAVPRHLDQRRPALDPIVVHGDDADLRDAILRRAQSRRLDIDKRDWRRLTHFSPLVRCKAALSNERSMLSSRYDAAIVAPETVSRSPDSIRFANASTTLSSIDPAHAASCFRISSW